MKITAGFHSAEDYISSIEAGADELFFGYVPSSWQQSYPQGPFLNRREVLYSGVQLGGENDLRTLASMVRDYGVPAVMTINSPQYLPTQYPRIAELIDRCRTLGFRDYIAADPGLIRYLAAQGLTGEIRLHVSGEYGEFSPAALACLKTQGIRRVIFPRHMSPEQMKRCTEAGGASLEYEAFVLNEKCHFHGAYCRSLHSDLVPPLCRVPYRVAEKESGAVIPQKERELTGCFGESGCGLCALWDLEKAGIGYGKIVGRGNSTENILRDIRKMSEALRILAGCENREEYRREMKRALYSDDCAHNCYY